MSYINWRKPLEWSNGEPADILLWEHPTSYIEVSGCAAWRNNTGNTDVAVDAKTGKILGCEDDYPHIRNVAKHPPVYLHLFHGRPTPETELDGWGFNGPTIGPLDYVHVTYMSDVKYGFQDGHDAKKFGLKQEGSLKFVGDLVEHDGAYYGDFSINAFKTAGLYRIDVIENDEVVHTEQFDGTELEAEQKLGDVWNTKWASAEAGRFKATLTCISGDGEAIRHTIEPLGDGDE
jgi:hypothetical protein